MVKRKKLESFIHPQIAVEFSRQVQEISAEQPGAIIQVVVPLMIEVNLQYMMDKLVVVYVPEETQIKRLAKRDSITEAAAANILASQLSIKEKVTYADHVISNEGTLEETRKHVEKLWETLKQFQKDRLK
jgi:dephospho-CoA kinase